MYDSVARAPLARAIVQVVAAEGATRFSRSVESDAAGRFALPDVPNGRFTIGFLHPMLDSLGLEPPLREILIENQKVVRVDLAIPSPGRIRDAICGSLPDSLAGGVIVGTVRSAHNGAPLAKTVVDVQWLEVSLGFGGVSSSRRGATDSTRDNGWFAVCRLPRAGVITVSATHGDGDTDRIDIDITDGFVRKEFYVGRVSQRGDAPDTRQRSGDGRIRGVVLAASGQPLNDARVGITDGPSTVTNARGEWSLLDAPPGTRILQIRALGHYPARLAVHVIDSAPLVTTRMSTLQAVLDTVRISASRMTRDARGFDERRRMGMGRFLTREDVVRRQPVVTSELLNSVGGVRVEPSGNGSNIIRMNGVAGERCSPAIYFDGVYMSDLTGDEIDAWVQPEEVAGIEVYAGTSVPAQFARGLAGIGHSGDWCGSIVIWTRRSTSPRPRVSWMQRTVTLVGVGAATLLLAALLRH